MQWRPIADAPRDGTVVAVWSKSGEAFFGYYWSVEYECWESGYGNFFGDSSLTHYMIVEPPIPEASGG